MTELENPGTKKWKAQVIKAFKDPSFQYELPRVIDQVDPLPPEPEVKKYCTKVTKEDWRQHKVECNKIEKRNELRKWLKQAYLDHYHTQEKTNA
jgi:hypothetical protein